MSPFDARHGTSAGYVAGCRGTCCRAAVAEWTRRARARRKAHGTLLVDGVGTRRRIRALMALGWSTRALDDALGQQRTYCAALLLGGDRPVRLTTAQRIAYLYERMAMTLPPRETRYQKQVATRVGNHAARKGWPPPLAWDDIDDPAETPTGWRYVAPDRATILAELDAQHVGITAACTELAVTRKALEKWCGRHDLADLYGRLIGREQPRYWRNGVSEAAS